MSRDLVHVNIIGQYLWSYLPKNVIWTRVKNWITSCAHVHVRIPTTDSTPLPGLTVDKRKLVKKNDADSAMRNAGNEVSSESVVMYCKANFYALCEPLYFPVLGTNIQSKNILLRNQVPLSAIHGTIHWLFHFRWKWFHLVTLMRDKKAASSGWRGTLDSNDGDDRMRASNKTPPIKPRINRKTIPGRIFEPYMLKFPEGIKR